MAFEFKFDNLETVIAQIEQQKEDLKNKERIALERVCQRLITLIQLYSNGAVSDELYQEQRSKGVSTYIPATEYSGGFQCSYVVNKHSATVTVVDKDLFFIEFGAGKYANGFNPLKDEISMPTGRGTYGLGLGRLDRWHFTDSRGRLMAKGTPATMPIFKAIEQVKTEIPTICKGVFE